MSKPRGPQPGEKNKYNQCDSRRNLSEIKLKRTDTTPLEVVSNDLMKMEDEGLLDLSQ
jgi:hypothetical protein